LILARLNSDYFLGGKLALDKGLANLRISSLAGRLSMDADQAASSIVQIVNNNMAEAIKLITVSKGIDPREYTLIAFGGAGPLHACELAKEVMIPKVVVPIYPGQFSALGTILSDIRVDKVVTLAERSETINLVKANQQMLQIEKQIREELIQEGYVGKVEIQRLLSLRYAEQNYEQDIPIGLGELTEHHMAEVYSRFHQCHKAYYGYSMPEKPLEIVHFKVIAIGILDKPFFPPIPKKPEPGCVHREVFFPGKSWSPCSILRRETLGQGFVADGPVIIEETASTTLVPPDFRLTVDGLGNLMLEYTGDR
jgi:N-methylhydantoinase A